MTPNDRKAELVRGGIRQSNIARAAGVSRSFVADVIAGNRRSERIEQAVAAAIGLPVEDVFPPRETTAAA